MSANAHGHTTAAWTGVTVSFIGFMLAGVAMVMPSPVLVVVGLVLAAAGAIVGKLLSAAGFGKKSSASTVALAKESATSGASV
ncbi:HGxxPAAW family protein [Streptacidiphilus rugosus]|uniref:HGxxPAAW family protein n=1 Tax=Streptacidiphilus rugosus TaxID=405783 RepID=UPI000561E46F|nr:HGxxPAAW family protein [Streptacidiphilus rugosus]